MLNTYLACLALFAILVLLHHYAVALPCKRRGLACSRFYPNWFAQSAGLIASVSLGYLLIIVFVLERLVIPSPSMMPNFPVSKQILATKTAYTVQHPFVDESIKTLGSPTYGEVIVTRMPHAPEVKFLKRVWALPGDQIAVTEQGLTINEHFYPFSFITQEAYEYRESVIQVNKLSITMNGNEYWFYRDVSQPFKSWDTSTVPENMFFVLGDNLDYSADSRTFGYIHQDNLLAALL